MYPRQPRSTLFPYTTLFRSIYEWWLLKELGLRGLSCASQKSVLIEYKGFTREEPLRFDLLVEDCLLVEAKAVEKILPIDRKSTRLNSSHQIISYAVFCLKKK